jgi:hypothetical protein
MDSDFIPPGLVLSPGDFFTLWETSSHKAKKPPRRMRTLRIRIKLLRSPLGRERAASVSLFPKYGEE